MEELEEEVEADAVAEAEEAIADAEAEKAAAAANPEDAEASEELKKKLEAESSTPLDELDGRAGDVRRLGPEVRQGARGD
jgi:hypothetical protein